VNNAAGEARGHHPAAVIDGDGGTSPPTAASGNSPLRGGSTARPGGDTDLVYPPVGQTDLGAIIAASSSGAASDAFDVIRSQAVGLDEFIARWIGRLRRRPYSGPPGPPGGPRAEAAS
jgi:hypothetical protein